MNYRLESILKKDEWNGEELGIIALSDIGLRLQANKNGDPYEQCYDMDKFEMSMALLDDVERAKYSVYVSILYWAEIFYNITLSQITHLLSMCEVLTSILREMELFECNADNIKRSKRINHHHISRLFSESKSYERYARQIKIYREAILDCYYFIIVFNAIIKEIAKQYKAPDLNSFVFETVYISNNIDDLNATIQALIDAVKENDEQPEESKAHKLEAIETHFPLIEYSQLKVSREKQREIRYFVARQSFFDNRTIGRHICRRRTGKKE